MPVRVWVLSALMLVGMAVALAGLALFVSHEEPQPRVPDVVNTDRPATEPPLAGTTTPGAALDQARVPPTVIPGPAGLAGVPSRVRIEAPFEIPFEIPVGPGPDAGFHAELVAYAERRQAELRLDDGLARLETVEVDGRMIVFNYRVEIDLRLYPLPPDPAPLLPGLMGWACYGVCFEFN